MRTFDASVHNRIANMEEVFPLIGGRREDYPDGRASFDEYAAQPDRYVLLCNEAGTAALLFENKGQGIFDMHTLFSPECRGAAALDTARGLIREMYCEHGAELIVGQCAVTNKAARAFFRKLKAEPHGFGQHPTMGQMEYFARHKADWLADHAFLINTGCQH